MPGELSIPDPPLTSLRKIERAGRNPKAKNLPLVFPLRKLVRSAWNLLLKGIEHDVFLLLLWPWVSGVEGMLPNLHVDILKDWNRHCHEKL